MNKKKRKLRLIRMHPITSIILLTFLVMIISSILSFFEIQTTYSTISSNGKNLENELVSIDGMFNFDGFKYLISNAAVNFTSFTPLGTLLLGLIGLSVCHASGFIDAFIKRRTLNINNKTITFIIIFLGIISSIINEVGYVILIPLSALVFLANGRNPLLGITAAFCGVAFGYGATLFAGSMEVNLVPITESASLLVDNTYHVEMLSNLFAIILSTIVLSIVGTIVIENIISKNIGRYKNDDDVESMTKEMRLDEVALEEQKRIDNEIKEKKGLKNAFIAFVIVILFFVYCLIPGLPFSGLLLDMNEKAYISRLFGVNSYFQDGFTFMVSMLFLIVGISYAIGAKTIKSDKDLIEKATLYLKNVGYIIVLIFFFSQFIAVFKKTNIGTVILALISNFIKGLGITGIPLVILVLLLIALSSLFVTTTTLKWRILAPVVVPIMMQANISPQFSQFVFRAGDSMTKGFSPFLAYFVIYLGYLNMYNREKEPITIRKALSFVSPYCLIISITWILLVVFIYLMGLPIGPGVYPNL